MRLEGMTTRRAFAYVPAAGTPVALTHTIEQGPWHHWPAQWTKEIYSSWRSLESLLAKHVSGKRVAMEYSKGDAVPYLDRVPAGVIEMVRSAGATVVSSGELVTRFYAAWNAEHIASHRRAAEAIASIAREAMRAGGRAGARRESAGRARADGVDPRPVPSGGSDDGSRPERLGRCRTRPIRTTSHHRRRRRPFAPARSC